MVWAIEYSWVNYSPGVHLEFPETKTDTAWSEELSNNSIQHLITKFASITPSTSQNAISSLLVVRFYRNSSASADDYDGDAFGLSFDIHYRSNTTGSRQEYIK